MIYLEKGRKPDYKAIPIDPGVYLFRAENNGLLYIGKAKCLKKRVSSYFTNKNHFPRIAAMVGQIRQIEWFVVDNEVEALLLESNLVKKLQPKYNIDLKDSKAFAYIKLSGEEFPRILTTRKVLQDGKYFGPYVDGAARNELMNLCVQLFKVRTCAVMPKRACLNYHIGICTAPCINNVTKEQYGLQVKGAEGFLKGERKGLVERLEKEMKGASAELNFEKALEKRMQIEAILHIEERQKVELVKNYDQDVVALVPNGDTCLIEMFTISKGVILGRREFRFDYYDGVFAEFVSRFYSTHKVPSEIIMNAPLWSSGSEKSAILGYLIALKGSKVKIT
ncbi:MAG TPA: excinuclease ABC subunit C, partial [Candidatus Diapherotrites archaeon]|nr:excinuclease ABC subunit C [Candidatus Diapherotrites archaeon]